MTWQQFLTEKVLGECWHEGSSLLNVGYHCRKCDKAFSVNRTFDNRSDLMDLYEQIEKDGKLISFLNYLNTACDWKDFDPIRDRALEYLFKLLFCLDGTGYEEKCKMVGEFYGWEGKMILNEEKRKEFNEVCEPVIKWLNDNCHPHIVVQIDCSSAKLFEGVCAFVTDKFIKG